MAIGSIIQFAGSTIPDNYLVCDGSAVSRTDYAQLYAAIGETYGPGDGVSTFNIPNLCDNVAIGASSTHILGTTGGEKTHTLNSSEVAEHLHSVPAHGHAHTIVAKTPQLSHTITQPTFSYNMLSGSRKVRSTGLQTFYSTRTSRSMSRSANLAISNHAASACTMSGSITDCAAMTSGDAGSGDAHNNMMPYIALVYLIQAEPDTPPGPVIPSMVLFNGAMPVGPSGAYIAGRR